jgi:hypothetical protein
MGTKNDPKNREKAVKKKLIGACGHEVVPVLVKRLKGSARITRYCEKCGVL